MPLNLPVLPRLRISVLGKPKVIGKGRNRPIVGMLHPRGCVILEALIEEAEEILFAVEFLGEIFLSEYRINSIPPAGGIG